MNRLIALAMLLSCFMATWAEQKVSICEAQGGSILCDKLNGEAGETVTLIVTPSDGYEISKTNISVEATIDPGSARAPRKKEAGPDVGWYIELKGNDPSDLRQERTYTFTMPESPLNVLIKAIFTKSTITGIDVIGTLSDINEKPVRYFNLQGRYIGTSLDGARSGVYITGNGRKVIK